MSTCKKNKMSQNQLTIKDKSLDNNPEETILITLYVNPHAFCYTKRRNLISGSAFVNNLESMLVLYCRAENQLQLYVPKLYVIVHLLQLKRNKLLRGRICAVCEDNKYLVWAMDYGFNIICRVENLWLLPSNLTEKYIPFEWGGLANVVPHSGNEWSEMSVNLFDQRLKEAIELHFTGFYKNEQQIFGRLSIKSDKDVIDAAMFLVDKKCARWQTTADGAMIANNLRDTYRVNSAILNEADFELSKHHLSIIYLVENSSVPLPKHNLSLNSTTSQSNSREDNNVVEPIPKETDSLFNNRFHKRSLKFPLQQQAARLESLLQAQNKLTQPSSAKRLSKVKNSKDGTIVQTALRYGSNRSKSANLGSSNSSNSSSFSFDSFVTADDQTQSVAPDNLVPAGQPPTNRRNLLAFYKKSMVPPEINRNKSKNLDQNLNLPKLINATPTNRKPSAKKVEDLDNKLGPTHNQCQSLNGADNGDRIAKEPAIHSVNKKPEVASMEKRNQSKINIQKNLDKKPERNLNKAYSADKEENKIKEELVNKQVASMKKLNLQEKKSLQLQSPQTANANKNVNKMKNRPKINPVSKNSVECKQNRDLQNQETMIQYAINKSKNNIRVDSDKKLERDNAVGKEVNKIERKSEIYEERSKQSQCRKTVYADKNPVPNNNKPIENIKEMGGSSVKHTRKLGFKKNTQQASENSNNAPTSATKPPTSKVHNQTTIEMPAEITTNKFSYLSDKLLAHSAIPVTPMIDGPESLFCADVMKYMMQMQLLNAKPTQLYAWPHLMRGNSLMLIERFESERSLCFLPTICCQVMRDMRAGTAIGIGPLAVLLTDTAISSQTLFSQCNDMMATYQTNMLKVLNTHAHSVSDVTSMLLNNCGILVTTVTHLKELLLHRLKLINSQRLKYFVLDEYDSIRSKVPVLLSEVLQLLEKFKIPQTIFMARQWHERDFPDLLKRFGDDPLLLISDCLEAAMYGGIKLNGTISSKENKTEQLLKYLELQKPLTKRTLIYCQDITELLNLKHALETAGYECRDSCNAVNQQCHQLFLLLDAAQLTIRNYEQVVHYSLPSSWEKFSNSFHAISNSISNYLVPSKTQHDLVSYIMLDEENQQELCQLVQFFRAHNFVLDETIKQLYANCQKLTERCHPICPNVLSSGECSLCICDKRHFTVTDDFKLPTCALWLPGTVVRCNLLKVYDPVHFAFMPLKYKYKDCSAWQDATNLSALRKLSTSLYMHMSCEENRRVKQCLSLSDVCVLRRCGNYQRVRIVDLTNAHLITVQLMDESTELLNVKRTELLECDARFTVDPPLAVDVRLCGLAPVSAEADWQTEATKLVTEMLNGRNNNQQLQFVVEFAMLDVVYVKEIAVVQDCPTMRTCVKVAQLQVELILQNFGKPELQSMRKLRKLHEHIVEEQEKLLKIDVSKEEKNEETDLKAVESEQDKELAEFIKDVSAETFFNAFLKDLNSDDLTARQASQNLLQELLEGDEKPSPTKIETSNTTSEISEEKPPINSDALYCGVIAGKAVRPKVRWHQTELQIELIFEQQVPQYELMHQGNVLIYQVTETQPPQRCILNLLGEVEILSERQHGYQLHVKLAKRGLNVYWPSLLNSLHSQQHIRWLIYDTERAQPQQSTLGLTNWTRYQRNPYVEGDGENDASLHSSDEPNDMLSDDDIFENDEF